MSKHSKTEGTDIPPKFHQQRQGDLPPSEIKLTTTMVFLMRYLSPRLPIMMTMMLKMKVQNSGSSSFQWLTAMPEIPLTDSPDAVSVIFAL